MNSFSIALRSMARKAGLIPVINRLRPARRYEDGFRQALRDAIKSGDTVWDVGANVGLYTQLFCDWVGPTGSVVAFEPFQQSLDIIRQRLPGCPWLRLENAALAEKDASGRLVMTESSTTHHLQADVDKAETGTLPITICRGDSLCDRFGSVPNVIKIDVEGFEEEVLMGLNQTLSSPKLRAVLIEVHFRVLEAKGRRNAPIRIENLLRERGFQTVWVDASHLKAERARRA